MVYVKPKFAVAKIQLFSIFCIVFASLFSFRLFFLSSWMA